MSILSRVQALSRRWKREALLKRGPQPQCATLRRIHGQQLQSSRYCRDVVHNYELTSASNKKMQVPTKDSETPQEQVVLCEHEQFRMQPIFHHPAILWRRCCVRGRRNGRAASGQRWKRSQDSARACRDSMQLDAILSSTT